MRPRALGAAGPLLVAWLLSPSSRSGSAAPRPAQFTLTEDERAELRQIARKTWQFFEPFVGDEDHWLPPDNYQEDPDGRVAHRTSPTNKGLLLLSTLAADDLGYVSLDAMVRPAGTDLRYPGRLKSTGDTSTTGTTPAPSSRSRPSTFRRSTAATSWPAWSLSSRDYGRSSTSR